MEDTDIHSTAMFNFDNFLVFLISSNFLIDHKTIWDKHYFTFPIDKVSSSLYLFKTSLEKQLVVLISTMI